MKKKDNRVKYTPEQKERCLNKIFRKLHYGDTLDNICKTNKDLPGVDTFYYWMDTDKDGQILQNYTRAREVGFCFRSYDMLDLADNVGLTKEEISKAQLQVNARMWLLSRLNRKIFGNDADVKNIHINIEQISGMNIIDQPKIIDITPDPLKLPHNPDKEAK